MKIELGSNVFEVVEVPNLSNQVDWSHPFCNTDTALWYRFVTGYDGYSELPLAKYQLLGTTTEIAGDEDKAHKIVDKLGHQYTTLVRGVWEDRYSVDKYFNYQTNRWNKVCSGGWSMRIFGALDSFATLCQKYNVKDNSVWLKRIDR